MLRVIDYLPPPNDRSFCLPVILSAGLLKSSELISLKLGVMIRPTGRKNSLTFGGADIRIPDHYSIFLAI